MTIRTNLSIVFWCVFWTGFSAFAQDLPAKGICAHRGASATHPENTLAAITEAVRVGVQMIEFDIRRTKDDALVLLHDATVDRTTSGKGNVEELTFREIRQLDAGSWKDKRFRNERIPTFQEVLAVIPRHIWMNIHIKNGDPVIAEKVTRMITQLGYVKNAVIACSQKELTVIRAIDPNVKICYMERQNDIMNYVRDTIRVKADFIQLTREAFTDIKNVTRTLKENGIMVNCYYAKSKEEVQMLWDAGVNFPLVNNVQEILD